MSAAHHRDKGLEGLANANASFAGEKNRQSGEGDSMEGKMMEAEARQQEKGANVEVAVGSIKHHLWRGRIT